MLDHLWAALGGDPARAGDLQVLAPGRHLPSVFDVDGLAVGAVGSMLLAAAELAEARGAGRPAPALDARHVAAAFVSERLLAIPGAERAAPFAPLSRFAPARDGWIRLHANYPHHRAALLRALASDEAGALAAIAHGDALELEASIVAAGGVAAAVRDPAAWAAHPQGQVAGAAALIERGRERPPRRLRPAGVPPRERPAAGLRVLDLTRVIAGPVATRVLAALGADVLRLDPPQLPEDADIVLDTCAGKRLAEVDLRREPALLERLLAGADVVVHGYRPGALAAFGLDDDALADRYPHLIACSLSAWGSDGPWGARRGFDSIVQAACGIAVAEATGEAPGALPAQALDHATGYLMAAAVLRAAAQRARGEPSASTSLALATTAAALLRAPAPTDAPAGPPDPGPYRVTLTADARRASVIAPPGTLDGAPLTWTAGPRRTAPAWGAVG
jgi:crotonobetainyl-CoA:carnitine CoA-transferase CaiB-like acyl-CoA transferase